ncbi:MAG: hypothetical protein U9Q77_05660 [Candidatus Marinimicrobia bacterium]|nr:hypothetical protein [Candidatus Neomarinimicrobiota bacterium]
MSRIIVLFIVLAGQLPAQTSHQDLARELLRDLQQAVSDCTAISVDQQVLQFTGDLEIDTYLNGIVKTLDEQPGGSVTVQGSMINARVVDVSLTLNRTVEETSRNTRYIRQLDLSVLYSAGAVEHAWQGRISDKLSDGSVRVLLDEAFPEKITGNYLAQEPRILTIFLTTSSVFLLIAALFFIRT